MVAGVTNLIGKVQNTYIISVKNVDTIGQDQLQENKNENLTRHPPIPTIISGWLHSQILEFLMPDPVEYDLNFHLAKEEKKARQQDEAERAADSRIKMVDADEIGEAMKVMGNRILRVRFLLVSGEDDAALGELVREIVRDYLYEDELSGL